MMRRIDARRSHRNQAAFVEHATAVHNEVTNPALDRIDNHSIEGSDLGPRLGAHVERLDGGDSRRLLSRKRSCEVAVVSFITNNIKAIRGPDARARTSCVFALFGPNSATEWTGACAAWKGPTRKVSRATPVVGAGPGGRIRYSDPVGGQPVDGVDMTVARGRTTGPISRTGIRGRRIPVRRQRSTSGAASAEIANTRGGYDIPAAGSGACPPKRLCAKSEPASPTCPPKPAGRRRKRLPGIWARRRGQPGWARFRLTGHHETDDQGLSGARAAADPARAGRGRPVGPL